MPDLNLRGMSAEVIRWAKSRAAMAGVSMRDWVQKLIQQDQRDAEARREKE